VTIAFTVIVALALLPQILFSILYWRWIPNWTKNPYGRLAQLGSWCHILLLSLYLVFVIFGKSLNPTFAGVLLVSAFVPLVVFGFLQLALLKLAVDSSMNEKSKEELKNDY